MEDRKPFKLRNVLVIYNFIQVLFSLWLFYEACMSGWMTTYSYRCQPVETTTDPLPMRVKIFKDSLCQFKFNWLSCSLDGYRLLVVLLQQVHRVLRHILLYYEKAIRSSFHSPRYSSRNHAIQRWVEAVNLKACSSIIINFPKLSKQFGGASSSLLAVIHRSSVSSTRAFTS